MVEGAGAVWRVVKILGVGLLVFFDCLIVPESRLGG